MYTNKDSIEVFNQMVAMGQYYSSARPVAVDPAIIIEDICSKVPVGLNDAILDVGCGTGVITIPLSRLCRKVYALDAGEQVIEAARRKSQEGHIDNVAYYLGSALRLPFEKNFFDHVVMFAVIHYLENEKQVKECIGELVRVCKPGGRILIAEIPDQQARLEFEQRVKTPQEEQILEEFKANRKEYDLLFKEHVRRLPDPNSLLLDCREMLQEGIRLGCTGQLLHQDIRQPLSLTRRDVLLTKK